MGHEFVTVSCRVQHLTITVTGNRMLKHNFAQRLNERMAYLSVLPQKERWLVEIAVVPSLYLQKTTCTSTLCFNFGVKFESRGVVGLNSS